MECLSDDAALMNLSRKTVFLIVLASGRHCSEVQSLPSVVDSTVAQDQVNLAEFSGFLAKNQAPTGSSPLVKIPTLTTLEETCDLDCPLCLVCALKVYFSMSLLSAGLGDIYM